MNFALEHVQPFVLCAQTQGTHNKILLTVVLDQRMLA